MLGQEFATSLESLLGVTLLVSARLLPAAMVVPWLGAGLASPSARMALMSVLTALAVAALASVVVVDHETATRAIELSPWATIGWSERIPILAREFAIGAVMAFATALVFWGADASFHLIDHALGGHRSSSAAPPRLVTIRLLGQLLAINVFLAVDGHIALANAFATSYRILPLGAGWDRDPAWPVTRDSVPDIIDISVHLVEIAVVLAAPVLVATAVTRLAAALHWRLAAGLQPASSGRALATLIGVLVLGLALFTMAVSLASAFETIPDQAAAIFQ